MAPPKQSSKKVYRALFFSLISTTHPHKDKIHITADKQYVVELTVVLRFLLLVLILSPVGLSQAKTHRGSNSPAWTLEEQ